jgi:hypothetical protein
MSLWHKIETAPASAALFSWKHRFGVALPQVQAWFLKPMKKRAETVPCPHMCGCIHRVMPNNRAVCGCGDCEDIVLEDTDVEAWMVNWSGLVNQVRGAFDLEQKASRFPVPKVWQVGSFGGDALQIILVVQPDRMAFNEAVAQLVARLKTAFVVLTPTTVHHDIESRELLGQRNAGLHDLESNMTILKSGRLVARKTAGELFSPYLPEVREGHIESEAKRVLALRKKLRIVGKNHKAPHNEVFDLLVVEDRSQEFVAREFECVPSLISQRVDEIEGIMGLKLKQLKALAVKMGEMESSVKGDRNQKRKQGARSSSDGDEGQDDGAETEQEDA